MLGKKALAAAAVAGLVAASLTTAPSTASAKEKFGECHGVNSCKGKGDCHGKADGKSWDCGGKNGCAGKGWKKMKKAECEKNILKEAKKKHGLFFKKG